jgi:hypothetical protein
MVIRDIFLILSIIYGIIISLGEIPVFISLGIYAIIIFILPCRKCIAVSTSAYPIGPILSCPIGPLLLLLPFRFL